MTILGYNILCLIGLILSVGVAFHYIHSEEIEGTEDEYVTGFVSGFVFVLTFAAGIEVPLALPVELAVHAVIMFIAGIRRLGYAAMFLVMSLLAGYLIGGQLCHG